MSRVLRSKVKLFFIWLFTKVMIPLFFFLERKFVFIFAEDIYKRKLQKEIEVNLTDEDSLYAKRIRLQLETEVRNIYRNTIRDLQHQVSLLEEDRNQWKKLSRSQKEATGESYWKGAKLGYKLGEKRKSHGSSSIEEEILPIYKSRDEWDEWWKSNEGRKYRRNAYIVANRIKFQSPLTTSQIFSLTEVSKGNRLVGHNISYLENNGYIKIVWDTTTEHHYELTSLGKKYLHDNPSREEDDWPIV